MEERRYSRAEMVTWLEETAAFWEGLDADSPPNLPNLVEDGKVGAVVARQIADELRVK